MGSESQVRLKHGCAEIAWPVAAVREAAQAVGISAARAEVLRIGHCATVSLPDAHLVARVGRPGYPPERLAAELWFALYIHAAGIPALRPAVEVVDGPIRTSHGPVTFWPLLRAVAAPTDWAWLGETLRRLHALRLPHGMVSLWDPLTRVEERLAAYATRLDAREEHLSLLSKACIHARGVLSGLPSRLGVHPIHGDPANVIVTDDGPILHDFDLSGVGPAEWDLVSIAVRHRRFDLSEGDLAALSDAYGFDVRASPNFEELLHVRELLDCSFALTMCGLDAYAQHELAIRVRGIGNADDRSVWTPLL
jgi:hypothetical protein